MLQFTLVMMLVLSTLGDTNGIPSRVLVSSSSKLLGVPSFGYWGHAQCDRDGNLFFHTDANIFDDAIILKLSASSWESTFFKATMDNKRLYYGGFSVSPSGQLWILGNNGHLDREQYIFAFDSDGKMTSMTKLDVPSGLEVEDFAVSDRGVALISGFFGTNAVQDLHGQTFVGLFQPSGKLLRRLNGGLGTVDLGNVHKSLHSGAAIFGEDGYLYLLHDRTILVISESGTLVRTVKFDKPNRDAVSTKIAVSGGWIAIWLTEHNEKSQIKERLLVLDSQTEEPYALYSPPAGVNGNAMCFNRKDGFEFYGVQDGRVKLTTAALR